MSDNLRHVWRVAHFHSLTGGQVRQARCADCNGAAGTFSPGNKAICRSSESSVCSDDNRIAALSIVHRRLQITAGGNDNLRSLHQ